jgi:hypothetical protein
MGDPKTKAGTEVADELHAEVSHSAVVVLAPFLVRGLQAAAR